MPKTPCASYLRTSSQANVGTDKDSDKRQRLAIVGYARRSGLEVVREFYDAAVSGADPVDGRPGFAQLLAWAAETGVRTIVVENATRFARDLMVQETGHLMLARQGYVLVSAEDPDAFTGKTPTADLIRQIMGAVSQFERATLVAKLRGARDRRSAAVGRRVEGRRGYADTDPDLVREARRLARRSPKTGRVRPLREIADELALLGHVTSGGMPFGPGQVKRLLEARPPRTAGPQINGAG